MSEKDDGVGSGGGGKFLIIRNMEVGEKRKMLRI